MNPGATGNLGSTVARARFGRLQAHRGTCETDVPALRGSGSELPSAPTDNDSHKP